MLVKEDHVTTRAKIVKKPNLVSYTSSTKKVYG